MYMTTLQINQTRKNDQLWNKFSLVNGVVFNVHTQKWVFQTEILFYNLLSLYPLKTGVLKWMSKKYNTTNNKSSII